jgi:hypothetical protein
VDGPLPPPARPSADPGSGRAPATFIHHQWSKASSLAVALDARVHQGRRTAAHGRAIQWRPRSTSGRDGRNYFASPLSFLADWRRRSTTFSDSIPGRERSRGYGHTRRAHSSGVARCDRDYGSCSSGAIGRAHASHAGAVSRASTGGWHACHAATRSRALDPGSLAPRRASPRACRRSPGNVLGCRSGSIASRSASPRTPASSPRTPATSPRTPATLRSTCAVLMQCSRRSTAYSAGGHPAVPSPSTISRRDPR